MSELVCASLVRFFVTPRPEAALSGRGAVPGRQSWPLSNARQGAGVLPVVARHCSAVREGVGAAFVSVSYTHLTLPTNREV